MLKRSRKLQVVSAVVAGSLLAPISIPTTTFLSQAFAADVTVSSLADEVVNMTAKANNHNSIYGTFADPIVRVVQGFGDNDWKQVLFGTTSLSDSQSQTYTALHGDIQSLLSFTITDSTVAQSTIRSLMNHIESLNPSIQDSDILNFLENVQTNASNNFTSIIFTFGSLSSADQISTVRTSLHNAIVSASTGQIAGVFSGTAGGIAGGNAGLGASDLPTTYQWLQTDSSKKLSLLSLLDSTTIQDQISKLDSSVTNVVIPFADQTSQQQVSGDLITSLKNKLASQATLTFGDSSDTYDLPLSLIPLDTKSVTVSITKVDTTTNQSISNALQKISNSNSSTASKPTLIGSPVDFNVTVNASDGTQQTLHDFGHIFTERSITIPSTPGFNPSLAAVVMWDGASNTVLPVPATFIKDNAGTYHAVVKRTGNSVYGVIANQENFQDIQTNWDWAKPAIDQLATRLVINGTGGNAFSPNSNVTRAEFISMLVRGLGLLDKQVASNSVSFVDVKATDWYAQPVAIAKQLGLVSGDASGKFNPNNQISREEMAKMVVNALQFVNTTETANTDLLGKFNDRTQIQSWATNAVALAVKDGIINGRTDTLFVPNANASRAEAAVMIERLLEHLSFINTVN